jgi:hypothetical protein
LWIHLFYTARLLTNVLALPSIFFSIYYFAKSQSPFNSKYFFISLFLLGIATLARFPNGLVYFAYLGFLILTLRLDLLKKRNFYISGILGVSPLLLFFVYNYFTKGNIFPALLGSEYVSSGADVGRPLAFNTLNFTHTYLQNIYTFLFILGFAVILFTLVIGFDKIKRSKILKSHLLLLLIYIIFNAYFIFYLRAIEDRWLFVTSISLVLIASFGLYVITTYTDKYSKLFSILLILGFLLSGAYYQLILADNLIGNRSGTFSQMREGFEWIKNNSPEGSVIMGAGIEPYATYYAERPHIRLPDEDTFDFESVDPDYFVIHWFTQQPSYVIPYIQENQDQWEPVHALFFDEEQTQPAFIVYKKITKLSAPAQEIIA